ncbi:hypothetical protein Tco_0009890 [Tanacetum coccineum]
MGNDFRGHIQAYVSQAAAANFNQGNNSARPPMVANQIRPPGFPPMQSHQNNQNRGINFNQNWGNNFNQNRGNNFSQGPIYQPQVNQPPAYQAPVYQAPAPQTQSVSKTDFDSYVKANDAVMRNMQNQNQVLQNQGQNLQAQLNNLATSNQRLESMLGNFIKMNTASTSGSGTLPGNTVTNPKEDLKGITTRSGVTIQGPKAVNHDVEVTKDTMPPANNGSTENVQPPVVQIQTLLIQILAHCCPVVTPVPKESNSNLSFEISFTDALMLMPKFASTLKTLIGNKEKLSELARTPLNENCSAVILNKLPKKLGDPGRFLIPCEFTGITTCNALADLELADRSITKPIGIAEDVFVNVGKFQFPADFVLFMKGGLPSCWAKEAIYIQSGYQNFQRYTADYIHMDGDKERRNALSISKLKAAYYPDFGLEELVPSLWIERKRDYDISAAYVRSHMRILSVVSLKTFSRYGYTYLKEIVLRRADYKEHKISEADFKNLHLNDFKDLYLLHLQGKLNHLSGADKVHLFNAVNLWIRNIVIRQRMDDLQLRIKSYQMKLNLTQPRWDATDFLFKEDYTIVHKLRAVIYKDQNNQKKMMRETEVHNFSDGTLTRILENLDFMVKDYELFEFNPGMEHSI